MKEHRENKKGMFFFIVILKIYLSHIVFFLNYSPFGEAEHNQYIYFHVILRSFLLSSTLSFRKQTQDAGYSVD